MPKDVTLGCAAVCNVPVRLVAEIDERPVTSPVKLDNTKYLKPSVVLTIGRFAVVLYNISPP